MLFVEISWKVCKSRKRRHQNINRTLSRSAVVQFERGEKSALLYVVYGDVCMCMKEETPYMIRAI